MTKVQMMNIKEQMWAQYNLNVKAVTSKNIIYYVFYINECK